MSVKKVLLLFFVCLFSGILHHAANAQPKAKRAGSLDKQALKQLAATEDTLAILAHSIVSDTLDSLRFASCAQLSVALARCLRAPNSFRYPFDRVKSVSILAPPDSSFRVFTWQLFVNDSTYNYYGLIQLNRSEPLLFELTDRSADMEPPPTFEALAPDQWYGVLYYNIRQFDTPKGRNYLLMGFDAFSFFERRKVIEVLSFDPKTGFPEFGAPVFERPDKPDNREHRIFFDYSAEAGVRVNWDEEYKMILCDHLLPMPSTYHPGITYVPDGSYDGFKLEKGRWVFVDKVFNDSQDEVPRPVPVLNGRGKDIMGREGKVKKGN